jgi:hypothetical protein
MGLAKFGGGDNNYCGACGADNAVGCASDCPRYDDAPRHPPYHPPKVGVPEEIASAKFADLIDRLVQARVAGATSVAKALKKDLEREICLALLRARG